MKPMAVPVMIRITATSARRPAPGAFRPSPRRLNHSPPATTWLALRLRHVRRPPSDLLDLLQLTRQKCRIRNRLQASQNLFRKVRGDGVARHIRSQIDGGKDLTEIAQELPAYRADFCKLKGFVNDVRQSVEVPRHRI